MTENSCTIRYLSRLQHTTCLPPQPKYVAYRIGHKGVPCKLRSVTPKHVCTKPGPFLKGPEGRMLSHAAVPPAPFCLTLTKPKAISMGYLYVSPPESKHKPSGQPHVCMPLFGSRLKSVKKGVDCSAGMHKMNSARRVALDGRNLSGTSIPTGKHVDPTLDSGSYTRAEPNRWS